ncbi:MAG TPA: HNH endonuclease [Desulfobacterales bacterium]|nr:HNH endonuclease [Desulfobacterales bacterium]
MPKRRSIPIESRRAVIERDEYTCQYCGKVAKWVVGNKNGVKNIYMKKQPDCHRSKMWDWDDPEPFEIDHIIPVFKGGGNDIDNLILSCRRCNREKAHG